MKLKRTKQCEKCPWKKSTNPFDIPGGYCVTKHENLKETIAVPGSLKPTKVMACHHSKPGKEMHCVGWLHNQLGVGNNLHLRLQMRNCENISSLKVIGEQHEKFSDTLPENK